MSAFSDAIWQRITDDLTKPIPHLVTGTFGNTVEFTEPVWNADLRRAYADASDEDRAALVTLFGPPPED